MPRGPSRPRAARHVVVLAGGRGTRFWPVGRESRPKQMLPLDGDDPRPLLRATVDRVRPLCAGGSPWVVANRSIERDVRRLLPEVPRARLLFEPEGRNTAAAVGLAAHAVAAAAPDASVAVVPSDHHAAPAARYRAALEACLDRAATTDAVVTVGIRPTRPATGYGWLALGRLVARTKAGPVHEVSRFVEKPTEARAKAFLRGGRHLWNAGVFVFRPAVFLAALDRRLPEAARRLAAAAERGLSPRALERAYDGMPSVSVDHGVMEHERAIEALAARLDWDDLGSWDAVARHARPDRDGSSLPAGAIAVGSRRCVVRGDGPAVALLGVDDLVVVRTQDAVLVARRGSGERVREVVAALRAARREDLLR
jgi:mannose-1-phosphate guanylyltransferase